MRLYFFCLYFFVYGFGGWCTEVAYAAVKEGRFVNRGFLNGPICPIYGLGVGAVVQFLRPFENNLVLLYVTSTILVTVLEGLTGFVLDKIFHNKWWDYSDMKFNIGGYVCLFFSLVWGVACVAIVKLLHPVLHRVLEGLPFVLGVVLIIVFGIGMFADLYVTASTILRFNRRLESMERIAAELHEISEKVGGGIYENVTDGMEMKEREKERLLKVRDEGKSRLIQMRGEGKERILQYGEEGKERILQLSREEMQRLLQRQKELRESYEKMSTYRNVVTERLLKAFPHMHSREYEDRLKELRERYRFF